MSDQPQEITADDVESATVEGQQDVGAQPPAEAPEAPAEDKAEAPAEEEKSIKQVGDRTDASGRQLFPWESLPKSK